MDNIFEIEFDAEGRPVNPTQEAKLANGLSTGPRHVVVLAHGWNIDTAEAREFYACFLRAFAEVDADAARSAIVMEVLWPSKKFADKASVGGAGLLRSLGPGSLETHALQLINLATFFAMKDRAGRIGRDALNPLIARLQSRSSPATHFHLVGHSFGGRMVTASVDGPSQVRVNSLLLLQAAYSQNGLALNFDGRGTNGFFYRILTERKVDGPILITHSKQDEALGLAYPLASRLHRPDAARIGDSHDVYGCMGMNGAQHVNATCLQLGKAYTFDGTPSQVINLNGDAVITSHGDVALPETAALLSAAIRQCAT